MYNEIEYTNTVTTIDYINSYCNKLGITNNNYSDCTITLPHLKDYNNKQLYQLQKIISKITFPYIGTIEYSTNKAKGYHFHFIASKENINKLKTQFTYTVLNNTNINNWISYISKFDITKKIYKYIMPKQTNNITTFRDEVRATNKAIQLTIAKANLNAFKRPYINFNTVCYTKPISMLTRLVTKLYCKLVYI